MKCSVCYSNFTKQKEPFIFNCGHSYHLECIKGMEKMAIERYEYMRCPDCRTLVTNIAKNYLAIELIDNEEEDITDELVEKYEEASRLHTQRMKESIQMKKEIKELKEKRTKIIEEYTFVCKNMINNSYIQAIRIVQDTVNKYTDPFKDQIENIKKEKEKFLINNTVV